MFSPYIESAIRSTGASQLTEVFLVVLVAIFFLSIWWKHSDKHAAFTNYTPTLLTSLGILGTFTGIVSGLLDFDTGDIDGSIGPLLGGLKTAFITSLVGMLLSITFKAVVSSGVLSRPETSVADEEELTAVDMYKVMKQQADGIEQLKKAISENDESSLVGQIKLLRSDISDNHKAMHKDTSFMAESMKGLVEAVELQKSQFAQFEDRLWIKLQDFADMLSKSATEQVIEALKQVITDFNNNLVEQFGDNFKLLNEAVHKLVIWQDNYKDQLSDMKEKYDLGVQAIKQTETSVAHISEEAKAIPVSMNELKTVIDVNQHQVEELSRHLEAFKDIRDQAVMAVPEIRGQIDQAIEGAKAANDTLAKGMQESAERMGEILFDGSTQFKESVAQTNAALIESSQTTANSSEQIKDQFSSALEDINNNMREMISNLQEGGKELNTSYKDASNVLVEESQEASRAFSKGIAEMSRGLEQTINEHAIEHRRHADQIFAGLERSIEGALSNTAESVQKQVEMIDKTAGEEIQKVMNSMGNALASISGKFTQDYSRLTGQMSEIVNQARVRAE